MNLKIIGDRSFTVEVSFEFYEDRKLWRNYLKVDDVVNVEEGSGAITAAVDFHVVGRLPSDIKQITLEYDGHTVVLDPGPDKFENLSPIILYDKGRDYWTNQLRRRAEEAGC